MNETHPVFILIILDSNKNLNGNRHDEIVLIVFHVLPANDQSNLFFF